MKKKCGPRQAVSPAQASQQLHEKRKSRCVARARSAVVSSSIPHEDIAASAFSISHPSPGGRCQRKSRPGARQAGRACGAGERTVVVVVMAVVLVAVVLVAVVLVAVVAVAAVAAAAAAPSSTSSSSNSKQQEGSGAAAAAPVGGQGQASMRKFSLLTTLDVCTYSSLVLGPYGGRGKGRGKTGQDRTGWRDRWCMQSIGARWRRKMRSNSNRKLLAN
ncbi:hypothetical protein AOQ84DRAFT_98340 [Glonium stellatum]|uniref:Uncharacterized protein n=1 Tax=Glonium stellatum TaxID=574774 RepID=A0A8E2JQ82_9PEZI|nr:hypothetical protein AOQ84DRAFT_98340 [Glonium stellatum]